MSIFLENASLKSVCLYLIINQKYICLLSLHIGYFSFVFIPSLDLWPQFTFCLGELECNVGLEQTFKFFHYFAMFFSFFFFQLLAGQRVRTEGGGGGSQYKVPGTGSPRASEKSRFVLLYVNILS